MVSSVSLALEQYTSATSTFEYPQSSLREAVSVRTWTLSLEIAEVWYLLFYNN